MNRTKGLNTQGFGSIELNKAGVSVETPIILYSWKQYLLELSGPLVQWFQNFSAQDPQNNDTRHWGPPLTLEVAHTVMHSHAHTQ